jgi:hypothetical protein
VPQEPEILPPADSGNITQASRSAVTLPDSWRVATPGQKLAAFVLSGGFVFGVFMFALGQFFQVRGVQSIPASRIFLAITWLCGTFLIIGIARLGRPASWKWISALGSLGLLVTVIALDRAFPLPRPIPHQPPDLELSFFVEKELRFNFINNTATTAHNPKYWFAIENYTHPVLRDNKISALPILTRVINDFVHPHSFEGNIEVLNPESTQRVTTGDRLFGLGAITCDDCLGTRNYWVYYEVGEGGWFSPIEPGTSGMPFFDRKPPSDRAIDDALDALVAKQYRIPMPDHNPMTISIAPQGK